MFNSKKTQGSSLVVSLGIMSLLLILSGAIMTTIFNSAHLTNNIANLNKAYFASEGGAEEALYELSNHLSGFETGTGFTFSNNSKYEYEIEYRSNDNNSSIPKLGLGNSPVDSNWNKIEPKETYNLNLFYDSSEIGKTTDYNCNPFDISDCGDIINPTDINELNLYIRTPDFDKNNNGDDILPINDVFVVWSFNGTSRSDNTKKYILLPITDDNTTNTEIKGFKINSDSLVLDLNTLGEDLEKNQMTIFNFLSNNDLHMPRLKISVVSELKDNTGNPLPYLEFKIEAKNVTLPYSYATITSEGYAALSKQTIQTQIKQEGAISLFDYAIFH